MSGVLSAAMGEVVPELTAELVADGAVPLDPVISPDGRWVAYVVTTMGVKERRVSALWVVPADASSPPRKLTPGTAWAGTPRWAPDSVSLLFVSGGQLYRIGVDGGDAEALTSWQAAGWPRSSPRGSRVRRTSAGRPAAAMRWCGA
jgi:Tol biopolymer transport system component